MGPIALSLAAAHATGTARGERSQLSAMGVTRDALMATFGGAIDQLIREHRERFQELALEAALSAGHQMGDTLLVSRSPDDPKSRWVDGTPENSYYIYELALLFPEARFIHLVRDPRSVARSLVHFHTIGGASYTADAAYREWLRNVRECQLAERALGSKLVRRVRYDDLVAHRKETVEGILEFVGEPYSQHCVAALSTRINSSVIPQDADVTDAGAGLISEAAALAAELLDLTTRYDPDAKGLAQLEQRFHKRSFGGGLSVAQRNLLRRSVPRDAVVLVAAGGDDKLLTVDDLSGWHFPQNGRGAPVAADHLSDDELIQVLERLRAKGAQFLLIPAGAGDVIAARAGVIDYLARWYQRIASHDGIADVWALAIAGAGPPSPPPVDLDPAHTELVERLRGVVSALVPPDAHVAVVSRGDVELLDLPVARAVHFPSGPGIGWSGNNPANDEEAVDALDAAIEAGATHILVPAREQWWFDSYPRFQVRLQSCWTIVSDASTCSIFALRQPARTGEFVDTFTLLAHGARPTVTFTCNICSCTCSVPPENLQREAGTCNSCGSTARHRAVIATLSQELFGRSLAIDDFPSRMDLQGIGLTDAEGYAQRLAAKLGYVNTYYHQEPHLDIQQPEPERFATLDFLIASDVFEHVVPPLSQALKNVHRLLKPEGVLVMTVPWGPGTEIVEHFPDLHEWEIVIRDGKQVLLNVTRKGAVQEFDQLVFHGGPGLALELRRFGEQGLFNALQEAGFSRITFHRANDLAHGAYWPEPWSQPVAARP